VTAPECPSCHATDGRPHTEYCQATPLLLAVEAGAQVLNLHEGARPGDWAYEQREIADGTRADVQAVLTAALPVLLDAVTVQAREHVAAGRGHMTWAETLTQLRRMTQTTTEESPNA
jgi:sugar phosphate isomerase/epimerase